MGWLSRADVTLLALILVNTVVIICHRTYRYSTARGQSRAFVRDSSNALLHGRFDEAISIATRNSQSHVASVVAAALFAFASTPAQFSDTEAIGSAQRASERRRKMLSADLKLGLGSLATTASCAPFIGLLGTVFGILNAFGGSAMAKSALMAMIASNLVEALATTAMGLLVAVLAVWSHTYFRNRVESFESGMSNATLGLVTYLHAHHQYRNPPEHSVVGANGLLLGAPRPPATRSWEVPYDRQRALMIWIWFCTLYLAFLFGRGIYWSYRWQQSYEEPPSTWEQVGGQESVSPDHRYRAVIPVFYREWEHPLPQNGHPRWSCGSNSQVALRIVPNDRPRVWTPHLCGKETKYTLEPGAALLTSNCTLPAVVWRSNDELLIKCSNCSADNLQLIKLDFFPRRITVLDQDGKRVYPRVAHTQSRCPD
jgi:biopolymer transport protein ExbB/biopolymer transport protein TolQ